MLNIWDTQTYPFHRITRTELGQGQAILLRLAIGHLKGAFLLQLILCILAEAQSRPETAGVQAIQLADPDRRRDIDIICVDDLARPPRSLIGYIAGIVGDRQGGSCHELIRKKIRNQGKLYRVFTQVEQLRSEQLLFLV